MTTKLLSFPALAVPETNPSYSGLLMIAAALAVLFALAWLAAILAAGDGGLPLGHLRDLLPDDPRGWSALTA